MLVVIGSMPMEICNNIHEILARPNNGKMTTFTEVGVPTVFDAFVRRFP